MRREGQVEAQERDEATRFREKRGGVRVALQSSHEQLQNASLHDPGLDIELRRRHLKGPRTKRREG